MIPKNSKMENTIWLNYTLKDLVGVGLFIAGLILIVLSNIKIKIMLAAIWLLIGVVLFIPISNELVYRKVLQFVKFIFSKKHFNRVKNKKGKESIDLLVPYTDIDENGYIVYPNYFGRVLEIKSREFDLLDVVEQNIVIEDFSDALKYLDKNTADIVKIDRPIIFDTFERELEEKIEKCKDNTKKNILISRLMQIRSLNEDVIYRPFYYLVVYANDTDELDSIIDNILYSFDVAGISSHILDDKKQTAVFLKYCNTRNFDEREIDTIDEEEYLDWIKPKEIKVTSDGYKIDDIWATSFVVEEYPLEVGNAWGADIFNIDNTKVVMHLNQVDQNIAIRRIDKAVNELLSREESLAKASDVMQQDTHFGTMSLLLESLQNENEVLFDVSFTVTAFAYDNKNLMKMKKAVRGEINNKGFRANALRHRQLEGLINSNISRASTLKKFERGINSSSLGAVFPFVFSSVIEPKGILLGHNNYPVIIDIWKRGESFQNSNGMVIGTSGSGKSFFLKTLLTHLYSDDCDVFILDPENEYSILSKNLDGEIIEAGTAVKGRINPFHIYKILTDDGRVAPASVVYSSHLRVLESFFKIIFEGASSEVLETINNAVVEMYYKKGITEDTETSTLAPEDFPTFEDLKDVIEEKIKQNDKELIAKGNLLRAKTYILKFTKGGRYSTLWNGASNLETQKDFTVFNFQSLFANKNNIVANAQMLLIFRYLEQEIINRREENQLIEQKKRTVIVADEAHLFIDSKFPIALEFFYQMTKRIRKYDGAFIPATQSISDWNATEELRNKTTAILKESQYNFILKLKPSGVDDLSELYQSSGGINDEEKRYIIRAKTGNMFFVGNDEQHIKLAVVADEYVQDLFENKQADVSFFTDYEEKLRKERGEEV